jgi:DNA-binding GntR family transcriptional regulator
MSGTAAKKLAAHGGKNGSKVENSLVVKAYGLIRDRLLRGELPFGAPISRRDLARELGMSALPVSAALQQLEAESLVESVPRVGTRVRIPTPQEIRGFYIVREALETQSARLFAERAGLRERKAIEDLAVRVDDMYRKCELSSDVSEESLFELRALHTSFHRRIAEFADCPYLLQAIEKNQILVFNWLYDRFFGRASLPEHWHVELAQTLALGDPEKADAAMRKHVTYQLNRLIRLLEPYLTIGRLDLLAEGNPSARVNIS